MHGTNKKLTIIAVFAIILATFPIASVSQSYKSLWKKVDRACSQDLPKSALRHLDDIVTLSKKENNSAQLLKALVTRMSIANDISEDSAKAMLPMIETVAGTQTSDTDKSLWNMALGWLYAQQDIKSSPQSRQKAIAAFSKATDSPDKLAATSSQLYIPVLHKGSDSRYYNHDMLSIVFPFVAQQLRNMHTPLTDSLSRMVMAKEIRHYQSRGNRYATLLAKIDSTDITASANTDIYKTLIAEFQDIPLISEVYARLANISNDSIAYKMASEALEKYPNSIAANSLKNTLTRITLPTISCNGEQGHVYPGEEMKLPISHRNITTATLTYTRLNFQATDNKLNNLTAKDYERLSQTPDAHFNLTFNNKTPYGFSTDTTHIVFPKSGIYLIKLQSPDTETAFQIMYVSTLSVMQLPLPDRKTRICVVDGRNGKPMPNAKISIKTFAGETSSWQDYVTNDNGELTVSSPGNHFAEIYASTTTDNSLPAQPLTRSYDYRWDFKDSYKQANIYTDRAIYRPGQTVKVGGFAYQKDGDSTRTLNHMPINLELYNTNNKLIESTLLTTDDFGTFGTDFILPKECLNGTFHIRCNNGGTSFRVEEYKRPTFQITVQQPTVAYTLGDTINLVGEITAITGQPLAGMTVCCSTIRNRSLWFRQQDYESPITKCDTIETDKDGKFTLPVALSRPDESGAELRRMFFTYTINFKATANDGETQENTMRIFAGNTKAWIDTNMPETICKEHLPDIIATLSNSMGKAVEGKGIAVIKQGADTIRYHCFNFNRKGQFGFLKSLYSGEYTIIISPEGETDRKLFYEKTFTLLSLNDSKTSGNNPLQIWNSDNKFKNNNHTVHIVVATPLHDTWLRYDLMANNKVVESKLLHLSDTILHFTYNYSEAYGNGIHAQFAILDKGTLHRKSVVITKPTPDKSLNIRWSTFRNKLTPGAEETWTMHITKDSVPVKASILATMYDASLNKFGRHSLFFGINYDRTIPTLRWTQSLSGDFVLHTTKKTNPLQERGLDFSVPDPNIFYQYSSFFTHKQAMRALSAKGKSDMLCMVAANNAEAPVFASVEEACTDSQSDTPCEDEAFDHIKLRTDFNETAFFCPSLKTDEHGNARIEFKLPESVTSWNFHAIAHTTGLDYAMTDTTIIAEKPFALHTNVPRFLRTSDQTVISVNITNNTGEKLTGKMRLNLTDAQTGKQLTQSIQAFSVSPYQSIVANFPVSVPDSVSLTICNVAGISHDFTDAEQQYIPILPDRHRQITTVPFTLSDSSSHTIPLKGLNCDSKAKNASLTFEYIANPIWTVLTAMPSTVSHSAPCATTLATNYAALTMTHSILNRYPQIRTFIRSWQSAEMSGNTPLTALENNDELKNIILSESPWERDAFNERQRLNALTQSDETLNLKEISMLDKLKELQSPDGGWQWFPGMPSNFKLTLQITETLMRSKSTGDTCSHKLSAMTDKAAAYLEHKAKEIVKDLKKNETTVLPPSCIEYLYVMVLANNTDNSECKYLLNHLKRYSAHYNIYHKSLAACILEATGHHKEALSLVRSLMEYTVYSSSTGRYFDSQKAPSSWNMYRIPTQLRALEAIQQTCPDSTRLTNQMKQWLLLGKHAQTWASPLDAVRAIQMLSDTWSLDTTLTLPATITLTTEKGKKLNIYDFVTNNTLAPLGYVKANIPANKIPGKPISISLQQATSHTSYGAVYFASLLPASQIKATSSDLTLSMKLYKETQGGVWAEADTHTVFHKGDRIKASYTIEASRDLDFVSLKTPRAACMEPVSVASGYVNGYYKSVEDASTTYFHDKLAKGTHLVEEIYHIDRLGVFSTAPAQVQCLYAPEFISIAPAITIHAK